MSARAKGVIEQLEPGVHQFLPVQFLDKKGGPLEDRWFLIVCNRIDSVDREHSRMRLAKGIMWTSNDVENPRLVFNQAQAAGVHLWRDKHLLNGPFLSDGLATAIVDHGLTGVQVPVAETV